MSNGYVYILTNQSIPEQLKIGMTTRDSRERARELSNTSVPTPFKVAFELFCEDCKLLESQLHHELADFRVSNNREFFRYPLDKAINLLQQLNEDKSEPENHYQAVDIMDSLNLKYPNSLREDIVAVRIVQPKERVWLEITTEKISRNGEMVDQTIKREDLAFISDDDLESLYFKNEVDVQDNAKRFVEEFGDVSIVMVTNLFKDDVCNEVMKKHNESIKKC
jgi:hypothetical protein